ncbi:MAG: glycosyltransferase family 4 protein [Myxococcota bacterium]
MNVALLVGRFGGGTGTGGVAATLARGLRDRGHRVLVACGRVDARPEASGDVGDGFDAVPLGPRWSAAARIPAGFVRLALDRVPGCEVARASGGVHRRWLDARGGRWVGPRDRWECWLDRRTARTAGVVICNAEQVADAIVAEHQVGRERLRLVRTGVDLARFRPDPAARDEARRRLGVPEGGRIAMFVGHGFRRKGLDTAVAAFARVGGPHDRLVVVGRDAHAERWLGPARVALGDRLVADGPRTPIERWLVAADALLLPSRYDAASNVILEAMACGVPPIASGRDGASEIVPDGRLVVHDPADVQGFADAVRYAWETPGLPAGCRAAAERWPDSRMTDDVERILGATAHG